MGKINLKINLKGQFDNSYDIIFSEKIGEKLVDFLKTNGNKRAFLIFDKKVANLYKKKIKEEMKGSGIVFKSIEIVAGEKNKEMKTILKICRKAQKYSFNRNDIFIAIGGGVIGDIVGFASSIYMRGVDFIQIPTTLVSIFDSSVGGKTGVNLSDLKNLIGTFHQPKLVLINKKFLETLAKKEVLSGYFEGLKHSILDSKDHFQDFIESFKMQNGIIDIEKIRDEKVAKNIQIKAKIVEQDEKEGGIRKFLNYGHTFGHGIELNSSLPHGICVGFGIIYVNLLGKNLGISNESSINEVNSHILEIIRNHKLPKITFSKIYKKMLGDKKNESGIINFVIFKDYGELSVEKVEDKNLLEKTYEEFLELIN